MPDVKITDSDFFQLPALAVQTSSPFSSPSNHRQPIWWFDVPLLALGCMALRLYSDHSRIAALTNPILKH
jgi:hypothetical protein